MLTFTADHSYNTSVTRRCSEATHKGQVIVAPMGSSNALSALVDTPK